MSDGRVCHAFHIFTIGCQLSTGEKKTSIIITEHHVLMSVTANVLRGNTISLQWSVWPGCASRSLLSVPITMLALVMFVRDMVQVKH
jgi:hypothetical protein